MDSSLIGRFTVDDATRRLNGEKNPNSEPPQKQCARLQALRRWCAHPTALGLASVGHEASVTVAEAAACLERLLALPVDSPARLALRGGAVGGRLVVGKAYGLTREGAVVVPWDFVVRSR